jgi:nicotinamidase-related amidase
MGNKMWRVLSLLVFCVGILVLNDGAFLIAGKLVYRASSNLEFLKARNTATSSNVSIPVRFLPDYDIERLSDGTVRKILKYGHGIIETTSDKVALVLVDCWEHGNKSVQKEPTGYYKNILSLLKTCRAHDVTIIHAPNHPVVDKYAKYHALRREVSSFLQRTLTERIGSRFFPSPRRWHAITKWPPPRFRHEVQQMRENARARHYKGNPPGERDISRFFHPQANEFVIQSSQEFRYVLQRRKINLLFYVGGSTNECILHRPTGVLGLVGSNYVIVLLSDCTSPSPSPWCDSKLVQQVFEDYYMRSIGYVADSKKIIWRE